MTTANYGYSVGKFIALAWISAENAQIGTSVEAQYTGQRFQGTVAQETLFDPEMKRMRA